MFILIHLQVKLQAEVTTETSPKTCHYELFLGQDHISGAFFIPIVHLTVGHGCIITSHSFLWDKINLPCPTFNGTTWNVYSAQMPGFHDDVIKWKHFPRYWPFVQGIHRWPVNSLHKGQWCGALMFSLICAWMNREAGDLRHHGAHYGVFVMLYCICNPSYHGYAMREVSVNSTSLYETN